PAADQARQHTGRAAGPSSACRFTVGRETPRQALRSALSTPCRYTVEAAAASTVASAHTLRGESDAAAPHRHHRRFPAALIVSSLSVATPASPPRQRDLFSGSIANDYGDL